MSPRLGDSWTPWTAEEDAIVLATPRTAEILERLRAAGYDRSRNAVLSRRKVLIKGRPLRQVKPSELAGERVALEQELADLERRAAVVRKRLNEVRYAQAEDLLGDIELPDDVMRQIRRQFDGE